MVWALTYVILCFITYVFGLYILANYVFCNTQRLGNTKLTMSFVFLFISGLPPTPMFFAKLWLISDLSGIMWSLTLMFMLCTNVALMYAYYDFFTKQTLPKEDDQNQNIVEKKIPWVDIILLSILFILAPYLFIIF